MYWATNKYDVASFKNLDQQSQILLKTQILQNEYRQSILESYNTFSPSNHSFFLLNAYEKYPLLSLFPSGYNSDFQKFLYFITFFS